MRNATWVLLVLFVFAIPWEYSLDAGAPFGHIARILGIATVAMAVPAMLRAGKFRTLNTTHWLVLALYLWFCCTYFWTATPHETLVHLRGYAQEMMLVWLVWEFAETAKKLQLLLRAWLAGSWLLAILTIAGFVFSASLETDQVRFVATGQDPNDVARFLVFGFPIAWTLLESTEPRVWRAVWWLYFPVGAAAVLLTASRSGLLMAIVALGGCGVVAFRNHAKSVIVMGATVISAVLLIFAAAPAGTVDRLGTTAELLQAGNLNQRVNIWSAGWRAFQAAPILGHGAGSFVAAAELGPEDTAHNTVLSLMVEGGLCALILASAIVVWSARAIGDTRGPLRFGLSALLLLWAISSVTGTVWESRLTWLLFGIAAVSPRLTERARNEDDELEVGGAAKEFMGFA